MGVIYSCEKPIQPQPEPDDKPAISIPTQSQAVFSNGISFSPPSPQQANQPQTQTVSFTTTGSWNATVEDTKVTTWLTVEPSSGSAGTVNMTVKAQPNETDKVRRSIVTIKCGTMSKSFTVEQAAKPDATVAVTEVTLNKTELALKEGDFETLIATVKPDDATDKTVTWFTSDATIATVDNNGKVTAVKEGAVTITAKAGEKSATCSVSVSKNVIAVTEITLNKTSLTLKEDESETLVATVKPDDATDKSVIWSTSDANVATVDESGKVTAVKEGSASITAKAGEQSATCKVTVSKNVVAVTGISLNKSSLTLTEGESETLVATVTPNDATDKTVTWIPSDEAVATVDAIGKVTAIKKGSATITARAGNKEATCTVTVNDIPVASITLSETRITLHPGETATITATITPDNASEQTITWTSSYPDAVTVDSNGKITAVAVGASTIHASCGGKSASCEVTVNPIPVESVVLNKTEMTLKEGESETLVATVKPDDATDKTVTWSSSNANIATVDTNGKVTAVKEGSATITAKAGEKSASCSVTVSKNVVPVTSISLNKTELSLKEGESETLVATVKPDDATNKTVVWSSSDPSIVTVDANGKITAITRGTAKITARAEEITASCDVIVSVAVPDGGSEGMEEEQWN